MGFLIFFPFVGTIMLIWICFLVIYAIIKFILYIFKSFGLLRIAKNEGYKYPYLVWIPIISNYILGKYCMDKRKSIMYASLSAIKILFTLCFVIIASDPLYSVFMIYTIFNFIVDMIVMNKFYKKVYKTPELFTILSVITLGLLKSVFIYTARIKKITKVNLN